MRKPRLQEYAIVAHSSILHGRDSHFGKCVACYIVPFSLSPTPPTTEGYSLQPFTPTKAGQSATVINTKVSPQASGLMVSGTSQTFFTGQHSSGRVQSSLVSQVVGPAGGSTGVAEVMGDREHSAIDATRSVEDLFPRPVNWTMPVRQKSSLFARG